MAKEDRDRRQARRRLRRADPKLTEKISKDLAIAYKPIEEWDWEELSRGRPRNKNGTFQGPRPGWITPAVEAERRRRITELTLEEIAAQAKDAMRTIYELMRDTNTDDFGKPTTPAKVRMDAAKFIIEQLVGKARTSVDVHLGDSPLEALMAGVLVNPDGEPSHQIVIDGEVVDPSDDEDDPGLNARMLDADHER